MIAMMVRMAMMTATARKMYSIARNRLVPVP
jgi:hypothetical protein